MPEHKAATLDAIRSTIARADTVQIVGATSATPRSPDASGPRYEHVRELGEGGMGRVDQARDRDLLRDVAVKVLRPELVGDPAMLDQFLWEARVTAHLDHPNIVPVHDIGRLDDGAFFTMKLVRGATLEAVLEGLARPAAATEQTTLPLARRLRLFLHLCNAIAFAHARGVLHRDLKPANVMLGEYGELLVTDWGLALPLDSDAGRVIGALMPASLGAPSAGTPAYMSPEQARGEPLDERSDVYALGVVLYEIAALARAFDGNSAPAVLVKVLRGDAPKLHAVAPSVPTSLVAVVERAMAVDRNDRYASVTALAEDVETVIDGRTPTAEHASALRRAARFYVAPDPGLSRLRVVDVDIMVAAGFALGLGVAGFFATRLVPFRWVLLVIGVLGSVPPLVRWLRRRDREGSAG